MLWWMLLTLGMWLMRRVIASYAKLIDTGAQGYVLVAWPRLSGEAKTLAAHYKMKVIEASTFEELERAFTTLLDGLMG